ncbi:hypothetical protein A1F99_115110 [Pyrenophora tritici-repentis]|nr:hypothetical protein A1F99_141450 [Pyrenophora tritici-repentis]KAF7441561.1 hypothetical protein A1F99_141190 [Pyrenophora tritici-repentis]KAF7441579.1 hypothetical protein A1F99_141130 [Pyrenophora tritici-repentis]KAF7441619.1 hypothetical protein A1F99_140530 [Pyrenophora tritici-repentis]KAF7441631.1 hypothetical protein A1F99_140650 [Pyrenophora tritici-repentis]
MALSWGEGLPTELQLQVARFLAADASIQDWVSFRSVNWSWREGIATAFTEWVQSQPDGIRFGDFAGSKAELLFC